MYQNNYSIQDQMSNPISYDASTNKNTIYWHGATKQLDPEEFRNTAIKEFDNHYLNE